MASIRDGDIEDDEYQGEQGEDEGEDQFNEDEDGLGDDCHVVVDSGEPEALHDDEDYEGDCDDYEDQN